MAYSAASKARQILETNDRYIAGGVFSLNRKIDPMRVFTQARGAHIWDADGNRYIDYHAAFAPYFLGHADPDVDRAVVEAVRTCSSLFGAGTTPWEAELAELLVACVPTMESVQVTNTGSEATALALRLARAATGRDGVVLMQGGYNGWEDDVAFNLMDPAEQQTPGPDGNLPLHPISAGIPESVQRHIRVVQFNDLAAAEQQLQSREVAAVLLEPILQNIGIVKPEPGYLEGLRCLCNEHGTLLIFDEIKTGFRHALGGYQSLCGVTPDLSTFGKAVANGYPLGVIGGKREIMEHFDHPDPRRRALIAGTYNGHPVPVAAAIATLKKLRSREKEIYGHTDRLGQELKQGLRTLFAERDYPVTVARQGSAFVVYFMDHAPKDWLDIARNNDMERDVEYRRRLIDHGIFHFPVASKQGSISFAHTRVDVEQTIEVTAKVLDEMG